MPNYYHSHFEKIGLITSFFILSFISYFFKYNENILLLQ